MARGGRRIPKLRHHKATDRAVVRLDGKDHYLGPCGPDSRRRFDVVIADWLATGRNLLVPHEGMTVAELAHAFKRFSKGFLDVATGAARDIQDPIEILSAALEMPEKSVVLLRDYRAFLGDDAQPVNPLIDRTIRDLSRVMKTRQQCLVICAPILRLGERYGDGENASRILVLPAVVSAGYAVLAG